jgi:hypothetical protein
MAPDLPTITNRYRLLELLGEGGMGAVYRAFDRLSGETVALKRMRAPEGVYAEDPLGLAHEFRLLASLRHPHIISVRDYGFDASRQPFFTMDLLRSPRTIVEAGRRQPLRARVALIQQMLLALAYLHRRGILHRDLKPANTDYGRWKGCPRAAGAGVASQATNRSAGRRRGGGRAARRRAAAGLESRFTRASTTIISTKGATWKIWVGRPGSTLCEREAMAWRAAKR